MIQPTVIQSSRLRVSSPHIAGLIVGLIWPSLYIFAIHPADHIGSFFKAIFALCALVSMAMALNEARKAWRIFKTPGDWKVTISSDRLMWDVAIPCQTLPLDVALADVAKALRLEMSYTGKDSDGPYTGVKERFELCLTDGHVLSFERETSGINPHRVFLALAKHGIAYEFWTQDQTENSDNTSKVFKQSY